ncbi:hypothetical protein C5688_21230 [Methylocystis sp. MitZ-2018]|nr:hypothetical protein C5688_21230 [Methylocystis sp. MitZ-2018]
MAPSLEMFVAIAPVVAGATNHWWSFTHVERLTEHQAPLNVCNFVTDQAVRRWANRHAGA